jgi:GNAT superfamily N-acetyltransferase
MSRQDLDLDAHLDAQGFTAQADLAVMLAEAQLNTPPLSKAWRIALLTQAHDLPAFIGLCAKAYASLGLPEFLTPSFFVAPESLLAPDVSIAVARDERQRISAAAMALHTGEVAGIYWVGTLPESRGHGLAAACTMAATHLALERGARAVTLQATQMGEPIYRRLGYREYGRMTRWSR